MLPITWRRCRIREGEFPFYSMYIDHYTIHGEETVLYCIVNRPKFEPCAFNRPRKSRPVADARVIGKHGYRSESVRSAASQES